VRDSETSERAAGRAVLRAYKAEGAVGEDEQGSWRRLGALHARGWASSSARASWACWERWRAGLAAWAWASAPYARAGPRWGGLHQRVGLGRELLAAQGGSGVGRARGALMGRLGAREQRSWRAGPRGGGGGERGRHGWAMRARAQEGEEGEDGLARGFGLLPFFSIFFFFLLFSIIPIHIYTQEELKNKWIHTKTIRQTESKCTPHTK
jgi:hypothetical protein